MVDTAVADDIPADCTITSDNYEAGVIIGKYFLQKHNTAKLVVMTHESARSARERVGGFLDTVSAKEKAGKKRGNPSRAGHGGAKRSSHTPPAINK